MVGVLSASLVCGLVGFAFHTLWIVATIVLALGLGYVFANTRRDHRDLVEGRREDGE